MGFADSGLRGSPKLKATTSGGIPTSFRHRSAISSSDPWRDSEPTRSTVTVARCSPDSLASWLRLN